MQIIGCSDLDGSNRKFLLEGVKHPYGLTVFGNDMYWTDWQKMSIMKANKFSGGDVETLRYNLSGLMDIHAVQLDSGGTVSKGLSTHNSSLFKIKHYFWCPCYSLFINCTLSSLRMTLNVC